MPKTYKPSKEAFHNESELRYRRRMQLKKQIQHLKLILRSNHDCADIFHMQLTYCELEWEFLSSIKRSGVHRRQARNAQPLESFHLKKVIRDQASARSTYLMAKARHLEDQNKFTRALELRKQAIYSWRHVEKQMDISCGKLPKKVKRVLVA